MQYKYIDEKGSFRLDNPDKVSYQYFPLTNESGIMSSISPNLSGDIKTGHNKFLLEPMSIEDIHNKKSNRNFWININNKNIWSATGNSAKQAAEKYEKNSEETVLEAGFLWHKIYRENKKIGIKSIITNFVPFNEDKIELMKIEIINTGDKEIEITPVAAIPIYGRSADNLRDHRHVTSLLNRIAVGKYGVKVKPTLSFDERGHKKNKTAYSIIGVEGTGNAPVEFYPILENFIGEGGSLAWPRAIIENRKGVKSGYLENGYEALGGIKFENAILKSGEKKSYIIIMGIDILESDFMIKKYGKETLFDEFLEKNIKMWDEKLDKVKFCTGDKSFNEWIKWVELQPILRRIYGCSFLPHHDYGRGGRGWRDLWQDALALILTEPGSVRELLYNNFAGVRIDGTNATIIGNNPGEFIADRNNIPRVWMDHGAWPFLTVKLYIDMTGDIEFLQEKQVYFKDRITNIAKDVDYKWNEEYGNKQKTDSNEVYKGTIIEHIILQNLSMFHNVGEHNNIRLEGADWNDSFDMAAKKGESVAFTALYASNLKDIARLILEMKNRFGIKSLKLAKEIKILLEEVNYNSVEEKREVLNKYSKSCNHNISGEVIDVDIEELSKNLLVKAEWLKFNLREKEFIETNDGDKWYNGYYDNAGKRVEGKFGLGIRMTLTGQVFPIMGGIATDEQIKSILKSADKYLKEEKIGGYRLNSNFNEVKLDLGRGFGFAFGHKENGAMFSHMAVMFANALYKRGFVRKGYEILNNIYKHSSDYDKSKIYPGIPEYINEKGRGMYHYLTGSASWFLLTEVIEAFGVKGYLGDLIIEPKLVKEQFNKEGYAEIKTFFAGKKLKILYKNIGFKDYGEYKIRGIKLPHSYMLDLNDNRVEISKEKIEKYNSEEEILITVILD